MCVSAETFIPAMIIGGVAAAFFDYRPDDLISARLGPRCMGYALLEPTRESELSGADTTSFAGGFVASDFG
jgi:hypothetical protein